MFDSLEDLQNFISSKDFQNTKKKIILFNADLKMKQKYEDILNLKTQVNLYFEELRKNNYKLYVVFSLNKKILEDEIKSKLNN
ncbi:MAG: hypothetical protein WC356_04650 [Candidatus Micrarchaeia archaeon]|jgi:hypothetical protein